MGRDEHNSSKGKQKNSQTPKQELVDTKTEFASEWANDNKQAQSRQKQAQQPAKKRK